MRIFRFHNFLEESLNDSLRKSLGADVSSKIITRWDGGYDILLKESQNGEISDPSCIFILRKTEKAYGLAYQKIDGSVSKYFWIPSYSCKLINTGGTSKKMQIPSYTKWFKDQESRSALDNFLNDFMEALEQRKNDRLDSIKESAKDDIDLVLDQLDLNDAVASIEKKSDYFFNALTENGLEIEMKKRSTEDLIGEITVYKKKGDKKPAFSCFLNGESGRVNFNFRIDDASYNTNGFFSEISQDHYFRYLLNKSLDLRNVSDEEGLVNYFESILSNHDWDYQMSDDSRSYERGESENKHIKEVISLLNNFLSKDKISDIYSKFSNSKREL